MAGAASVGEGALAAAGWVEGCVGSTWHTPSSETHTGDTRELPQHTAAWELGVAGFVWLAGWPGADAARARAPPGRWRRWRAGWRAATEALRGIISMPAPSWASVAALRHAMFNVAAGLAAMLHCHRQATACQGLVNTNASSAAGASRRWWAGWRAGRRAGRRAAQQGRADYCQIQITHGKLTEGHNVQKSDAQQASDATRA
jgi:hypothetical protein